MKCWRSNKSPDGSPSPFDCGPMLLGTNNFRLMSFQFHFQCLTGQKDVRMDSPISGRKLYLSNKNRCHIENIWTSIVDKAKFGGQVFQRIFSMKPSLKTIWGFEQVSQDELKMNERFKHHAVSFAMFLDIIVSKLRRDPEDLVMLARNVGKRHTLYKSVSFDAEYWLLFKNSVLDELENYYEEANCPPTLGRNLWNQLLSYLILEMKDAFYNDIRKRHSADDLVIKKVQRNSLFRLLQNHYQECHDNEFYNDGTTRKTASEQLQSL